MKTDSAVREADVVVVGAGASGIPAALAAAREGMRVVLVEEDPAPGGACVDQYVAMICDAGKPRGGIFAEIQSALTRDYDLVNGTVEKTWSQWYLPADYQAVVSRLLRAEPTLHVFCGVQRCRPQVEGGRIQGVVLTDAFGVETRLACRVLIDATGAAEMAALAGCEMLYGREGKDDFGEAIAPDEADDKVQLCTWQYITQNLRPGNRFNMDGVRARPMESGYGWLSVDNAAGWERNTGLYLHWGCRVRCADTRDPVAVAAAQSEGLALMEEDHRCLRENGYAVHLAPKIGVRESRRLHGRAVITANDLVEGVIPQDTVFVTERGMDIWTEGKSTMAEYPPPKPYGIPYRALLPQSLDGLLVVGKALSGTHLAMSAYRTQSIVAYTGEAAGVAAALSVRNGTPPAALDTAQFLDRLQGERGVEVFQG